MPERHPLESIKTFPSLVKYLRDELDWPIDSDDFEDLTFDFSPEELGLDSRLAAKVRDIKQLRPLTSNQPWGIFFVSFEPKNLPVVALRKILGNLVVRKRASANKSDRAAWELHDLLFISAFGDGDERQMTLAHFSEGAGRRDIPTLKVLGWDEFDTGLKLQHVDRELHNKLRWPADVADVEAWRSEWSSGFTLRHRQVIATAKDLALQLAELAKAICQKVKLVLEIESDRGPLKKLYAAFSQALIHDLSEADFADMFAQTITYGLFSTAVSGTVADDSMGNRTYVDAERMVELVPVTNPFLKEMLSTFLTIGGRRGKLDFDELGIQDVIEVLNSPDTNLPAVLRDFGNRAPGEDPVIHFYEDFLKAYDKKRKVQRGVFYTPQPVVSYIVRSVHELLQTHFGLADGLADTTTWGEMLKKHPELKLPPLTDAPGDNRTISPDESFVQILDPATGTATFLVEVIDVIHRTLAAKWKQQRLTDAQQRNAWDDYVPQHLLPRLHAFELMMAPYAIAHMKIGLKLAETGYRFGTDERARIYLTNALEPWVKQLPLIGFDALAHEAAAVNEIKRHKRFTVVIGNPPYSLWSQNLAENLRAIVDRYRFVNGEPIKERGALQFEKILQDDYVKFFRLSQVHIDQAGCGILGLITNHAFADNPTLRGMRDSLLRSFPTIFCANLHGNSSKKEKCPDGSADENVFDIQQGVAIFHGLNAPGEHTQTRSCADLWGSRVNKYATLAKSSISSLGYCGFSPTAPFLLFKTQDGGFAAEYERAWKVADMFQQGSMGVVTARDHISIAFEDESLLCTATEFRDSSLSEKAICKKLGIPEKKGWNVAKARALIRQERNLKSLVTDIDYRPFDTRRIFYHRSLVWGMSWPTMQHVLGKENIGISTTRSIEAGSFQHVFVSARIIGHHFVSLKEVNYFFPLWDFPEENGLAFRRDRTPNLKSAFLRATGQALGLRQSGADSLPAGLTPEDIFQYAYAVFHSPSYRSRYADFLKMDFPRLPLTGSLVLFRALARLGGELTALHLLESPHLDQTTTDFIGVDKKISKVGYLGDTVWINAGGTKANPKGGTSGFRGVTEEVWNFHIGGYQVCEKWLKDRKGRTLSADDIAHYQRIVIALTRIFHPCFSEEL